MTKEEKIEFWQKVKAKFIKLNTTTGVGNPHKHHFGLCYAIDTVRCESGYGYDYKKIFNLKNARKHANATGVDEGYFWWDIDRNWDDPYGNHHCSGEPGIKEIKGVYDFENRLLFLDWIINNVK